MLSCIAIKSKDSCVQCFLLSSADNPFIIDEGFGETSFRWNMANLGAFIFLTKIPSKHHWIYHEKF